MTKTLALSIGGETVEEWDRLWLKVEGGLKRPQPQLRHQYGLYRVTLNGQIVAVGMGTDKVGGLAKRLSDFRRPSQSGRNHYAGQLINENLDRLEVEVLITGSESATRELGRQLKTPMIRLHKPVWSAWRAPFMRKG